MSKHTPDWDAVGPELLEALEAVLALPAGQDALKPLRRGIGTSTPLSAWLHAEAAIAKAKGETP